MSMKIVSFTFVSFFVSLSALGQVSGKLTTSEGQPLPFANVLVLNSSDSTLVQGSMTTESGDYTISNIPAGNYFMRFSAVGYKPSESSLFMLSFANEQRPF